MQLCWLLCYLTVATTVSLSHERELREKKEFDAVSTRPVNRTAFPVDGVCRTKHCLEIANSILRNRNASVDPCDDFYEYVCGSWNTRHSIPPTEVSWSQDNIVTAKLYRRIRAILEQRDKSTDIAPIKMARRLYRSCMDLERVEKMGVKPILEILDKQGGWPMAMPPDEWPATIKPWQEINMNYLLMLGNPVFFSLNFDVDENNTDRYILTIDRDEDTPISGLKVHEDQLFKPEHAYMNGIAHIVQTFAKEKGYKLSSEQLTEDIIHMVLLEVALINADESNNGKRESTNPGERMTINELQNWYDSINGNNPKSQIEFLPGIQNSFKLANIEINGSEPIIVRNKEYLSKLANILQNTTTHTIVNFLHWNMVSQLLAYTNKDMRTTQYNLSPWQLNVTEDLPRWQVCVDLMQMKHAIGYTFVKTYFSDKIIYKVTDMISKMEEELENRILNADWIPDYMKTFMKEKLNNIIDLVAYPEWYKNETVLINQYKGLEIGQNYLENILNCRKFDLIRLLKQFRQKTDRHRWDDYPLTVNAFYSSNTNAIVIPAAILQEPYFTPSLPDAVNYGAVGFVIGHELSHSFDNDGIEHDKTGHKITWPKESAFKGYEKRAECFEEQFSNFVLDILDENGEPLTLDGHLTEDENMADTTGVQAAFAAYKRLKQTEKRELKLPGLEDTTDEQLFFLSFANAWCSTENLQYAAALVEIDEHSPSRYRVIGSLINTNEFAKTYKCPAGSPMNPSKKCSLWK